MQLLLIHRGDRIRTYGIRLPKTALYQTELHPAAFLQVNALFLKIIEEFIVLCQDIISINRQTIICPPVCYYILTLSINIETLFCVKVTVKAGVQINH